MTGQTSHNTNDLRFQIPQLVWLSGTDTEKIMNLCKEPIHFLSHLCYRNDNMTKQYAVNIHILHHKAIYNRGE